MEQEQAIVLVMFSFGGSFIANPRFRDIWRVGGCEDLEAATAGAAGAEVEAEAEVEEGAGAILRLLVDFSDLTLCVSDAALDAAIDAAEEMEKGRADNVSNGGGDGGGDSGSVLH